MLTKIATLLVSLASAKKSVDLSTCMTKTAEINGYNE